MAKNDRFEFESEKMIIFVQLFSYVNSFSYFMKKIVFLMAALAALVACSNAGDIHFIKFPVRFNKIREEILSGNPADYKSQNIENMQRVRDFLHDAGVYFIATVDGDKPQVRPFGTAEIIEGKLYIQTGHVKNVAKQIEANPNVAICAYAPDKGEWIRISATLVEDHRVEVKKAMLDANPGLRRMYDENDDNTAVYFMKDAKATISSFVHDPVEVDF